MPSSILAEDSDVVDVPSKPFNDQTMKEFSESEEFWKDLLTLQDIALVSYEDSKSMLSVFDDCALTFESLCLEVNDTRSGLIDNESNFSVGAESILNEKEFNKESFEEALNSPYFWDDIHAMHMEVIINLSFV